MMLIEEIGDSVMAPIIEQPTSEGTYPNVNGAKPKRISTGLSTTNGRTRHPVGVPEQPVTTA